MRDVFNAVRQKLLTEAMVGFGFGGFIEEEITTPAIVVGAGKQNAGHVSPTLAAIKVPVVEEELNPGSDPTLVIGVSS